MVTRVRFTDKEQNNEKVSLESISKPKHCLDGLVDSALNESPKEGRRRTSHSNSGSGRPSLRVRSMILLLSGLQKNV